MGTQFHSTRVAIIGAGNVGATCAYALLLRGLATELVLVDVNKDKAEGDLKTTIAQLKLE
jgi:L-lactate dehydrogenase